MKPFHNYRIWSTIYKMKNNSCKANYQKSNKNMMTKARKLMNYKEFKNYGLRVLS